MSRRTKILFMVVAAALLISAAIDREWSLVGAMVIVVAALFLSPRSTDDDASPSP